MVATELLLRAGLLLLGGCACSVAAAPTRVLFIGNSFTFVNDLPHQLVNIARSLGKEVEVANSTIGGCTESVVVPHKCFFNANTKQVRCCRMDCCCVPFVSFSGSL